MSKDERAIGAIKGSIVKWVDIINETGEDKGSTNCDLCMEYEEDNGCAGCPIVVVHGSKFKGCRNTPYVKWSRHHHACHGNDYIPKRIECPDCKAIALSEVQFLEELLKEYEGKEDE